jgi:hypothetical protein
MSRTATVLLLLLIAFGASAPARAQKADACKSCREVQQACRKAHSKDACNTDYVICMRHCRVK